MGGTELRALVAHAGRLYAGNGYWMDSPGSEGRQGAQILALDGRDAQWRVDQSFSVRSLAVSALREVSFTTDGTGARLPQTVSLLIASTWDLDSVSRVFTRDDATGAWRDTILVRDRPMPHVLPQVRSFGTHRDRETGVDYVFAGQSPHGVFSGTYDATIAGRIRWSAKPELDLFAMGVRATTNDHTSRENILKPRVTSFAECNGRLYATLGAQVFERIDGTNPHWHAAYTDRNLGHSETGLRGLTTIPNPSGTGEVLLTAVEGSASRILRIDPTTGADVVELDVIQFLSKEWGARVGYAIAAYNDMTKTYDSQQRPVTLIGLEAFVARRSASPVGHTFVNVGYGQLDDGGWYAVRHSDGRYSLQRITTGLPLDFALVSTRVIAASPFSGDGDALYFGGYDANYAPVHNSAWIVRTTRETLTARKALPVKPKACL